MEICSSARKHDIADDDIAHALVVGEIEAEAKVLHLGPHRAANLLGVVSVLRDDGSEIVIHAMRMRPKYEPLLRGEGGDDD